MALAYEKHYYRAGNRLTLTVVLDDFTGKTRVCCKSGGGGEGLFRFDWGASERFEGVIRKALAACAYHNPAGSAPPFRKERLVYL